MSYLTPKMLLVRKIFITVIGKETFHYSEIGVDILHVHYTLIN